jgi:phage terminase large subunit-like protein
LANNRKRTARLDLTGYATRATQYCRDIVSGKIKACKLVRLACQRHLDDLVKARSEEFPYRFDKHRCGKVCAFIERFPHVKGRWARDSSLLQLQPWQCFIVCSLFGWVEKTTHLRRFREAFILVPRKNGKTVLGAGIGNYLFVGDGEPGSEVYTGASNKEQAKEVFTPAAKMARRADGFKEWFGITIAKESMYCLDEGSKFEIVIGNPGDGASPHCFIHDEFHEQPTFAQYDTAKTGMMAREQALQFVISTAGVDIESPCHTLQRDVQRVLDGTFVNDRLFGLIYTLDDPDKVVKLLASGGAEPVTVPYWATVEAAREANPNFGVSVLADNLMADVKAALQRPNRQNAVKTKNFNIWVNARVGWMDMVAWKKCADPSIDIEDFVEDPCYEGFDLGARIDLTSRCKLFVRDIAGIRHYYAFGCHYVPVDRANDGDHPHYERWLKDRCMVGHAGPEIQLAFVQKEVEADIEKFNYARLIFDPHQAMQMQQEIRLRLGENDATPDEEKRVLDLPQAWKYLSPAMKEVEAAVLGGRFHHTGDPVLQWAVSCVFVKPDANENIFPRKEENRINKIDPASALFNAMYPALSAVPESAGAIEVW